MSDNSNTKRPTHMLTLKLFKEKLSAGAYANRTAAKRALGKVLGFTEEEMEVAKHALDKHLPPPMVKGKRVRRQPGDSEGMYVVNVVADFLKHPHIVRIAVIQALHDARRCGLSCSELEHVLKVANSRLRIKSKDRDGKPEEQKV